MADSRVFEKLHASKYAGQKARETQVPRDRLPRSMKEVPHVIRPITDAAELVLIQRTEDESSDHENICWLLQELQVEGLFIQQTASSSRGSGLKEQTFATVKYTLSGNDVLSADKSKGIAEPYNENYSLLLVEAGRINSITVASNDFVLAEQMSLVLLPGFDNKGYSAFIANPRGVAEALWAHENGIPTAGLVILPTQPVGTGSLTSQTSLPDQIINSAKNVLLGAVNLILSQSPMILE